MTGFDQHNPDVLASPIYKALEAPPEPLSARMIISELVEHYNAGSVD